MKYDMYYILKTLREHSQKSKVDKKFSKTLNKKLNAEVKSKNGIFQMLKFRYALGSFVAVSAIAVAVALIIINPFKGDKPLINDDLLNNPVPGEVTVGESLKNEPNVSNYVKKVGGKFVSDKTETVPGVFNLTFKDSITDAQAEAYIASFSGTVAKKIPEIHSWNVTVSDKTLTVDKIPSSGLVASADPETIVRLSDLTTAPNTNYTYDTRQWGMRNTNAVNALQGVKNNSNYVTVAVIDSGACYDHPDLQGMYVEGYNIINPGKSPIDDMGHGCQVAGIIAASVTNGVGVGGISPKVKIMPIKVFAANRPWAYSSEIADAIILAKVSGADIINLSLGSTYADSSEEHAIEYAREGLSTLVVAAAGNNGNSTPFYPAAFPGVIGVGSIDGNGSRSWFSNYGNFVDLSAPGGGIYATTLSGQYKYVSGTSFASPHVAGAIALEKSLCQPILTHTRSYKLYLDQVKGKWNLCDNAAPVITSAPVTTNVYTGKTFLYQVVANDPEGAKLTYSYIPAKTGATIDKSTGLFTWTNVPTGVQSVKIIVSDGERTAEQLVSFTAKAEQPTSIARPTGTKAYCIYTPTEVWIYMPKSLDEWGIDLKNPAPGSVGSLYNNRVIYGSIIGRNNIGPNGLYRPAQTVIYTSSNLSMSRYVHNNYKMYSGWFAFAVTRSNFTRAYVFKSPLTSTTKSMLTCSNL